MRREERLTNSSQFASVFKRGQTRVSDYMVLRAMPNGLEHSRFGFIVSKKVEKRAVVRNRIRRLMREAARLTPVKPGWDIVVIARKKSVGACYGDIESAMIRLLGHAGLLDVTR